MEHKANPDIPSPEDGQPDSPRIESSDKPQDGKTSAKTVVIMVALCSTVLLASLDQTVVTTGLPIISEHFQSSSAFTWVGSAYLLANASTTPNWGKISDIFGRKPTLLLATLVFFIGSLVCGLASSIAMLVAGRAVQGAGGGGITVLVNICISDLFSVRHRSIYFGIVSMVWAVASAASWRWCFYINLPITGFAMALLIIFLPGGINQISIMTGLRKIDWSGTILIVSGTVMFLLGLEFGGVSFPWSSPTVICLIVFGFALWVAFIINEWKWAKHPITPLRLFRHKSNVAALGVCFLHGMVFIAGPYYLPLYFQTVLGASPMMSGVYLLPYFTLLSVAAGGVSIYIKKTGKYLPPIYGGLFIMTLGHALLIDLPAHHNWAKIIIYQMIAGFGCGPVFQSPLIALQSLVSTPDIATATATFGFLRNIATSMSIVLGGVIFQNGMQSQHAGLTRSVGLSAANLLSGSSAGANVEVINHLPPREREVVQAAFRRSLQKMWIFYACLGGAAMIVSAFIGRNQLDEKHPESSAGLESLEVEKDAVPQHMIERDSS
ncbi:Efflux pump dotC [Cladobotryum mycophilum]|uniref:Efflux pump dotC n=1 Tax=Cladobotryum mycophilum TaxID=491253 RepID=A0ABR0T121_9HYPO